MSQAPARNPARTAGRRAPRILLIEDAVSQQAIYRAMLTAAGHNVAVAATGAEGLAVLSKASFDVVLLDLFLPDRDGLALMADVRRLAPAALIVVITAQATIARAVEAMRAGAQDFLVKPLDEARLLQAVDNALSSGALSSGAMSSGALSSGTTGAVAATRQTVATPVAAQADFVGSSPALDRVQSKIRAVAASTATVFITGESGTGKELAALAVHRQSPRAQGPFIALNCGAIPQDLLESEVFGHMKGSFTGAISDKPGAAAAADGGTLFLDEVCEMLPALQTKLLRFLQTSMVQPVGSTRPKKVNVRIVCATNRDPMEAVRRGAFREDLYYRLYVVPIHMPPLRDRADDMIEIANSALALFAREEGKAFDGLSPEVQALFRAHPWPGNVRQLLNVIRNVVVLNKGGLVTPGMLPDDIVQDTALSDPATPGAPERLTPGLRDAFAGLTLAEVERQAVMAALSRHGGSVPRAARDLDVSPSTLYRKLQAWGVNAA
jgi:DNA-binding NtrC family response regulator